MCPGAGARRGSVFLLTEFLGPQVATRDFGCRLDLNADQSWLVVRRRRVVVEHHRHQLAVHNVEERVAACDDGVLVPVVHADEGTERVAIANRAHQFLAPGAEAFHDLTAPRKDPHGRVLGIELTRVHPARPEVGLRAGHHPVEIHRPDVGDDVRRDVREPGQSRLASVLNAAPAIALDLDLELQREVFRLEAAIHDVAVAARVCRCRFADDGTVLDAPEFRIAVPALEADAVEQRNVAFMIVEVHGSRLRETAPAAGLSRRRLLRCTGAKLKGGPKAETNGHSRQLVLEERLHRSSVYPGAMLAEARDGARSHARPGDPANTRLEADQVIAPFVDLLERESRNLPQILERLARTVLGPVRNPRRRFFPQQRRHALELDRRGAVHVERFRRLALELLGEVVKDLLQLVLAGLHAEIGHLREHAFPSLARETDGGGALRLVALAADAHRHVLARAVGQLLRESLRTDRYDEDTCDASYEPNSYH